jgi:hypothetical protein
MRQPTWQEIEAEAQRRGKLDFDNTGRSWTLAEKIVEVMNEGWTPPKPVDPDVLAFREWIETSPYREDDALYQTYLAGARMAREREQERAKVLLVYVRADTTASDSLTRNLAHYTLAKYNGEA